MAELSGGGITVVIRALLHKRIPGTCAPHMFAVRRHKDGAATHRKYNLQA